MSFQEFTPTTSRITTKAPVVSVDRARTQLRLNKAASVYLSADHVRVFIDAPNKTVMIQGCHDGPLNVTGLAKNMVSCSVLLREYPWIEGRVEYVETRFRNKKALKGEYTSEE